MHGNDGWGYGGGVLSFYVRVPLLMCLVSSYPLLFKLIPYNFGLSASLPVLLLVLLYVVVGCGKCVSKRGIWRV
ncbi:hypothetical protein CRN53_13735 [Vibrio vulnificus]|nr:hypothetical protein CRN53_13735 [Vibrio vulnificus]